MHGVANAVWDTALAEWNAFQEAAGPGRASLEEGHRETGGGGAAGQREALPLADDPLAMLDLAEAAAAAAAVAAASDAERQQVRARHACAAWSGGRRAGWRAVWFLEDVGERGGGRVAREGGVAREVGSGERGGGEGGPERAQWAWNRAARATGRGCATGRGWGQLPQRE